MSGIGSRGGKVIGRTKSGKPIYASHDHKDHSSFSFDDHTDAAIHHSREAGKLSQELKGATAHSTEGTNRIAAKETRLKQHKASEKAHLEAGKKAPGYKEAEANTKKFLKEQAEKRSRRINEASDNGSNIMDIIANGKFVKSKIEQEIENLSKSMEAASMTPKEQLITTINELGPEGLRAKMPELSKSEQAMLKDVLEDMKKAKSPAMDANYAASYVRGNVNDTILQEDKADDDQDEKLVDPKNAKMNNQGDNSPEGFEGQVIKGCDVKDVAKKEAKEEVESHEKEMHKKDVKKSIEIDGQEIDLEELKTQAEEVLKSEGVEELTAELVKGKMKAMLAEEKQSGDAPEMNESTRAKKEKMPDQIEEAEANKMAQDKVDDMNQGGMKKSVVWEDENALLKANTGGRNHHFSVNSYYDEALSKSETTTKEEVLEKSDKEYDLNDLIEKDMDTTWSDLETTQNIAKSIVDQNGTLQKSFEDNEIAAALGLSEEEAKKILGE